MDDITTCYERGGQPEWDHNDYTRDFTYWGIDRSQPIALPLSERLQPMSGISEFVRAEEATGPGDGLIDGCAAQQEGVDAQANEQRVDISELLIAMKNAIERMGRKSTHRGIMVTAGSVIIHLITENRKLAEICEGYHQASLAHAEALSLEDPSEPLVSLT